MTASPRPLGRLLTAVAVVCALTLTAGGQTRIVAPTNRYSLDDDLKLGREAAAEVGKQLPLLNDQRTEDYVEAIGRVLTAAIPPEFQHAGFRYTFDVVNQKEINAFALPGGPMFLNRGMIESAATEGEMAGVMAHEISHVALRHGTAQATAGQKFQIGSVLGQIVGAVVGGAAGSIISQGSQIGFGAYFLKYSRSYESQADLLGAQILARAGYDPREMANMFKTIESEGGNRGPEWLSSHPNPGNRYEAINREAQSLRVHGSANTGRFAAVQSHLRGMKPAYTAEQIAKGQARSGTGNAASRAPVPPPAGEFRSSRPFPFLRLSLPTNWSEVSDGDNGRTYAPEGGYVRGQADGFTHGLQLGVAEIGSGSLQRDTEQLIASFARSNPALRREAGFSRETVGGRDGLRTTLSNSSNATGQTERIWLTTAQLADGRLLYLIGVSPESESGTYDTVFRRVRQSVQLSDR